MEEREAKRQPRKPKHSLEGELTDSCSEDIGDGTSFTPCFLPFPPNDLYSVACCQTPTQDPLYVTNFTVDQDTCASRSGSPHSTYFLQLMGASPRFREETGTSLPQLLESNLAVDVGGEGVDVMRCARVSRVDTYRRQSTRIIP